MHKKYSCLICGSTKFRKQQGKIDSKWGFTAHKVSIIVCEECGNIQLFTKGRTIFDFD